MEQIHFTIEEATPVEPAVLQSQGLPDRSQLPGRIAALLDDARDLFVRLAEPRALTADLSAAQFADVYGGEGLNSPESPLESIYPKAEGLALFAATLGEPLSARIGSLFAENEPALGYMLDAVASAAADHLADQSGRRFLERLVREQRVDRTARVLPYSPGYCGWHISGQRRLFEFLQPERIGIALNSSCLMQPLKSVSGVLVAGGAPIHKFRPRYSFCADCRTHECLQRMAAVVRE
ncbi:MAG: vitamin B12 dependent-methionine synthase activation domain-containing protein [Acidobacteriota bacterium]